LEDEKGKGRKGNHEKHEGHERGEKAEKYKDRKIKGQIFLSYISVLIFLSKVLL